MGPIRRYLRITKYSVLECRIYLDNPALAQSWLLNPRKQVLPRIIESVRPLVLPKLREEKERSRKKSTKKRAIKDVVIEDDFEVSIFLTETNTRHSLLTKRKHFREKVPGKLQSNSSKLISEASEAPIDVDDQVPVIREEPDDEVNLDAIPAADDGPTARSKRRRRQAEDSDSDFEDTPQAGDRDGSAIQIDSDAEEDAPPTKRSRRRTLLQEEADDADDKKKMAMDISYEGFAIYGRVLCLVVKRRDTGLQPSLANRAAAGTTGGSNNKPSGHAMMENWITSTQVPAGADAAEGAGS